MREIKVWKMILIWFVTTFLLGIIPVSMELQNKKMSDSLFGFMVFGCLLLIVLLVGRLKLSTIKERFIDFKENANWKELLIVLATQIGLSIGISNLVLGIVAKVDMNKALELVNDISSNPTNFQELALVFITAAILAPILEEIAFRRCFFLRFSRKIGFIFGAILSSIIFGMLHDVLGAIGAGIFGFAACILYLKYKNIVAPIFIHFANNFIAMLFTSYYLAAGTLNTQYDTLTSKYINELLIYGIILTVVFGAIFIRFVIKNRGLLVNKGDIHEDINCRGWKWYKKAFRA